MAENGYAAECGRASCGVAEYLGIHSEKEMIIARVWAPNAESVSLCLEPEKRSSQKFEMKKEDTGNGVWCVQVPKSRIYDGIRYGFLVSRNGVERLKRDPYSVASLEIDRTASVYTDISGFEWTDGEWLKYRKRSVQGDVEPAYAMPLNIYEIHLGSWRTRGGKNGVPLNYREIADQLIPYMKQMGYTHVQIKGLLQGRVDADGNVLISSFYAPDPRYGSPFDLMYLINSLHVAGIGVIAELQMTSFPVEENGLSEFDGEPLYESCAVDEGQRSFD